MNELQKRKPNRLKDYDYSQNGAYFVTICTQNRENLFGTIIVGATCGRPRLHQSAVGEIVENEIKRLSQIYDGAYVDCYVVMPNHVHMAIIIRQNENAFGNGRPQVAPTVSHMIKQLIQVYLYVPLRGN